MNGREQLREQQNGAGNGRAHKPAEPRTLDAVLETFQRWLYLPDPGVILAVLGAIAANLLRLRESPSSWDVTARWPSSPTLQGPLLRCCRRLLSSP